MAEENIAKFVLDVIASQNSMQRKCEKMIAFINTYFEEHLLRQLHPKHFFIELTNTICGEFFIWIFDSNRQPTHFGLKCYGVLNYMEINLVQKSTNTGAGEGEIITCGTKGNCELFPNAYSKLIEKNEEIIPYIIELANLLVSRDPVSFITPVEKKYL